jgi:hypothetical protein
MRWISILFIGFLLVVNLSCAGSETKKNRAEEAVHKERLNLIEDYKKCMKKAGDDQAEVEACDKYLKAAEALN